MVGQVTALFLVAFVVTSLAAEQVGVAAELERLSATHGFTVRGMEQTVEAQGKAVGDGLYRQLRRLLENFDHVIVQDAGGEVERVIVLGEKVPFVPATPPLSSSGTAGNGDILIETQRRGNGHMVQVSLEGKGGNRIVRELQVDTGADYLVLPLSLAAQLGADDQTLIEQEMQTANGRVKARIWTLPTLWLGERRITAVATAFLEDRKLGGSGLLGMSVLGRYKLTIDDEHNRLTLSSKGTAKEGGGRGGLATGDPDQGRRP